MIKKSVVVLGVMAFAASAWAQPLVVGDADFEMVDAFGDLEFDMTDTPWFPTSIAGRFTYGGIADFGGTGWVPGGAGVNQVAFSAFYDEYSVHQELVDVYLADTTYRYELDVVGPWARGFLDNVASVTLAFDWGTVPPENEFIDEEVVAARATVNQIASVAITDPLLLPDADGVTPVTRVGLTHYVPVGASYIGQNIQISFGGAPVPGFDNVTVEIIPSPPAHYEWNQPGIGDWSAAANWNPIGFGPPGPPNGNNHFALFGGLVEEPTIVGTNAGVTVNRIEFDNATNSYAVSGLGSVSLAPDNSTDPTIEVTAGSHQMQVAVFLTGNTTVTAAAGTQLDFNNQINLNGNTLDTSPSAGTVNFNNSVIGGGSITASAAVGTAGSTSIAADLTLSGASTLDIDLGNLNTDHFDVTGNVVLDALSVVDVTLEPGFVPSGSYTILTASGSLTDNGLTLDPSDTGTFSLAVNSNTVVLTALGGFDPADLNMDGFVDGLDLGIQLGSWNQTVAPELGELNGVPPVDGLDLGILLGVWNPPPLSAVSGVPEPAGLTLMLVGLATVGLKRSREFV